MQYRAVAETRHQFVSLDDLQEGVLRFGRVVGRAAEDGIELVVLRLDVDPGRLGEGRHVVIQRQAWIGGHGDVVVVTVEGQCIGAFLTHDCFIHRVAGVKRRRVIPRRGIGQHRAVGGPALADVEVQRQQRVRAQIERLNLGGVQRLAVDAHVIEGAGEEVGVAGGVATHGAVGGTLRQGAGCNGLGDEVAVAVEAQRCAVVAGGEVGPGADRNAIGALNRDMCLTHVEDSVRLCSGAIKREDKAAVGLRLIGQHRLARASSIVAPDPGSDGGRGEGTKVAQGNGIFFAVETDGVTHPPRRVKIGAGAARTAGSSAPFGQICEIDVIHAVGTGRIVQREMECHGVRLRGGVEGGTGQDGAERGIDPRHAHRALLRQRSYLVGAQRASRHDKFIKETVEDIA